MGKTAARDTETTFAGPRVTRILAVLEEAQTARQCLALAAEAARIELGATLTALHVEADPSHIFSSPEEVSLQRLRVPEEGTSRDRATRVRQAFDQWIAFSGSEAARYLHQVGPVEATLDREAEAADLIVVARPHNLDSGDALHAALFDTHKPVLFVPEGSVRRHAFTEHLAVVWRLEVPTRRALRYAMPWLRAANRVSVIPASEAYPVDEAVETLRRNGIVPEICRLGPRLPGEHAGAHILRRADEVHASGLVMGAYRFGMVLEWLFDSTTNQIFAATRLPLLVMH